MSRSEEMVIHLQREVNLLQREAMDKDERIEVLFAEITELRDQREDAWAGAVTSTKYHPHIRLRRSDQFEE